MSEPKEKVKRWYDSWRVPVGNALFEAVFLGLVAVGSVLASWLFGFERWSATAKAVGAAIVVLIGIIAIVVSALIWAHRMRNSSTPGKPADTGGKR